MTNEKFVSIIQKGKPLYQKVIDKKVISFMYWSHLVIGLIGLIIMISGLSLPKTNDNKTIALALSIAGVVLLCVIVLTFYTFEFIRRRTNSFYTKEMSISHIMKMIYDNQLTYSTSNQVELNKEVITKFISSQVVETYMTKEMDFINLSYEHTNLEVGYFIATFHDIAKHDNPSKTCLFIAKPVKLQEEFFVSSKEARDFNYQHHFNIDGLNYYTNTNLKPSKQLKTTIKKLHHINQDIDVLVSNHNIYLFLIKPNTYLMLGHKSYSFWKNIQTYLVNDANNDAKELKDIIRTISCIQ